MGHTQALEDKDLNQTDIMNELFVSFISFYAVAFTEFAVLSSHYRDEH